MLRMPLLACAVALVFSAGCTSTPAEPNGGAGESGTGGNATTGGKGGSASVERCPTGTNPRSEPKPIELGTISGQLVDEQGDPTSAGLVQVCGKDICINARVGSNGKLAEVVDDTLDAPACKFGDGLTWGKLAIPLESGDTELGTLTAVRLPDFSESVPFTPGERVSSGGVTLTLAPKARVEVDLLTYEDEAQQGFRAAALPEAALAQLNQDFVAGFALSPVETRICPSPALSLENTANLAPGTALELLMLGLDVAEHQAPYAQWQRVGEGQVSDDGATLEFPDGLPVLTAIGIRVLE
jgi:hypothetical protein